MGAVCLMSRFSTTPGNSSSTSRNVSDPVGRVVGRPTPVGIGLGRLVRRDIGAGDEPVGEVELPQLGQREVGDQSSGPGRPINGGVVADHQLSVGGGMDVKLNGRRARGHSTP